jgi:prevent-host-death family protein
MVIDHGNLSLVETIAISKFKATCLKLLDRVKRTGEPLLVTKMGEPIAFVSPPPPRSKKKSPYGAMKQFTEITGDILSPLPAKDWKVLS